MMAFSGLVWLCFPAAGFRVSLVNKYNRALQVVKTLIQKATVTIWYSASNPECKHLEKEVRDAYSCGRKAMLPGFRVDGPLPLKLSASGLN
jgi:hypothetical protein